jgi:low affinity Fe/Cu permease
MTEPSPAPRGRTAFDRFAERVSDVASGAAFFTVCLLGVLVWLPTIWIFSSVDTWQLVINTVTSVMAFLLIALLQNSERRTDRAAGQKLDRVAAALADLLELQLEGGDRERVAHRIRELRDAVRIEEDI